MSTEPLWWTKAREMRARGLSYPNIGRRLGKNHTSVMYAVNDSYRAKRNARQGSPPSGPRNKERDLVVARAKTEARETGQHIDAILIAWGTYPRRERRRAPA